MQHEEGLWYIDGGIHKLAEAMEKLARKLGVDIHFDTSVKRINYNNQNEATIKQVKYIIYSKLSMIKALENLEKQVVTEIIYTPKDFEGDYNAKFGAAFGLMPTLAQSNYYRPPNVSRDYKNLYFAGASVYPGVGVPIVLTSAKITVDAMLEDINNSI
ncbi:phytoene desaturase family protein [Staphylococcus xylosus]|uniref:phytoene desaturase family protein n=1 Tax=Staphylococcus xylosus TaxID=1288 RepID=UPI000E6A3D8E|nr:FAD-dependent oxidoreductase [Staphylococcus xylosus]RIM83615.1 hypothetical protein BU117_05615 [Staphylococcus xylosus]